MVYYNTPARLMSSHACRELLRRFADSVNIYEDIQATMHLQVEQAFIEFSGPRQKYKPHLVLQGKPVKFVGNFPDHISECRLVRETDQQLLSYQYELTRYNLAELCKKGLFEPGFQVPNIIRHNIMELPCRCDLVTFRSDSDVLDEPDPMLVFIRVRDGSRDKEQTSLICFDSDRIIDGKAVPGSGYVISDYFETMPDDGYVMSESPEAMDKLASEFLDESTKTLSEPEHTDSPSVNRDGYLFGDIPEFEEKAEEEISDDSVPDELSAEDQAAVELFERVKREANEAYEQRERQKREQAAHAAMVQTEPDSSDDLSEQKDESSEAVQDMERHNPVKLDHVRDVNKAANIDTVKEYLEEADSVDAGDLSQVDFHLDDAKKEDLSKRKLPDISGIKEPDTDSEYLKE